MPVKASEADRERGQRLAQWLARVRPDLPKTRRGPAVFGVSRETVANWINGADINNDAIGRILEVGGCSALATILGVRPARGRRAIPPLPTSDEGAGAATSPSNSSPVRISAPPLAEDKPDEDK